jgi:hypothetical protein
MSNNDEGMVMIMSTMMSMFLALIMIPISIFVAVQIYRNTKDVPDGEATLDKDPGDVADDCVVLMNNAPSDNTEGKTEQICLGKDETSRKIDLKNEYKHLHDELSAVRVSKNITLDLYEHKEFGGGYLRLDGDALRASEVVELRNKCINDDGSGSCSGGTSSWNDNVSSLQLVRNT